MPSPIVFPSYVISPDEYPAFRRDIGPNLPDTYDEWLKLHRQKVEEARRNGDSLIQIEVQYDEFLAYCSTVGTTPDENALLDFTIKQAGWKP